LYRKSTPLSTLPPVPQCRRGWYPLQCSPPAVLAQTNAARGSASSTTTGTGGRKTRGRGLVLQRSERWSSHPRRVGLPPGTGLATPFSSLTAGERPLSVVPVSLWLVSIAQQRQGAKSPPLQVRKLLGAPPTCGDTTCAWPFSRSAASCVWVQMDQDGKRRVSPCDAQGHELAGEARLNPPRLTAEALEQAALGLLQGLRG